MFWLAPFFSNTRFLMYDNIISAMVISEDYIFTSTFSLIKVGIRSLSITENIHVTGSISNMALGRWCSSLKQ
jgi:hypothetical protein